MPAFTPNRNYPYSVPGDPADVAQAIEDLAEAVDADVQALIAQVGPRPMARVRGTVSSVQSGTGFTSAQVSFDTIDFNIGGAIGPLTDGTVNVLLNGAWVVFGTAQYLAAGSTFTEVGLDLVDRNSNTEFARANTHSLPGVPENVRNMDLGGFHYRNPVNPDHAIFMRGFAQRNAGTAAFTWMNQTMTLLRMTES